MLKRPRLGLPKHEEGAGRAPYVIALVVQFAMLVVLASVLSVPVINFFRHDSTAHQNPVEDITYIEPPAPKTTAVRTTPPVQVPPKPPPETVPPPGASIPAPPPAAPPVTPPPAEIPVGVTPPRGAAGDTADRRVVGRGGIVGLTPGVVDPRLLGSGPAGIPDGPVRIARPSTDSAVRSWVREYWDSVATAQANKKNPNDWTFERNGDKYGLDQQWVYFGKFKLPTALLALLPISGGNPNSFQRSRDLEYMRKDIMFQAMRAQNEEDFTSAVKALRARKDAEHQADIAKKVAAANAGPVKPPQ